MSEALSVAGAIAGVVGRAASVQFQQSFGINPILLTGGIAATQYGGMMPISTLLQQAGISLTITDNIPGLDVDAQPQFIPVPGATLIDNKIGEYPFANQTVAANAVIAQPLKISLVLLIPVSKVGGYQTKLAMFMALQAALKQHATLGGTYTVATPAFIWPNCILTMLHDVSGGESRQVQYQWQWDFEQPLLTLQAAQQAQNNQMQQITNGVKTNGASSGPQNVVGNQTANTQPYTGGMAGPQ